MTYRIRHTFRITVEYETVAESPEDARRTAYNDGFTPELLDAIVSEETLSLSVQQVTDVTAKGKRMKNERCDCSHKRVAHNGATPANNGGNECRKCDCPVYTPKKGAAAATLVETCRARLRFRGRVILCGRTMPCIKHDFHEEQL